MTCDGKSQFATWDSARFMAFKLFDRKGRIVAPYACGGHWHLGRNDATERITRVAMRDTEMAREMLGNLIQTRKPARLDSLVDLAHHLEGRNAR